MLAKIFVASFSSGSIVLVSDVFLSELFFYADSYKIVYEPIYFICCFFFLLAIFYYIAIWKPDMIRFAKFSPSSSHSEYKLLRLFV